MMTLLAPGFLWALAALLPLALIYLIRVRPRRKTTTAYFLWAKVMPETRPNRLFQRLRDVLSLLLLALAVGALALGLAEPRIGGGDERNVILVIDASASMSRRETGGKTRLELAKEAAGAWVRDLRGGRQAMLVAVDGRVRQLARLTSHPPMLLKALEGVEGSALPLDSGGLGAFMRAALESGGSRVVFFTDGCAARLERLPEGVEWQVVGAAGGEGNAGLMAADLQVSPETSGALTLLARVRHDFEQVKLARIEVGRIGEGEVVELLKVVPVRLEPGVLEQRILTDLPMPEARGSSERWRVELMMESGQDALALDDRVDLVLARPQPVRVAVLGDERFFPVLAVRAFEASAQGLEWVEELGEADVALVVGETTEEELAALPREAGRIVIRPEGESLWWEGELDEAGPDEAVSVVVVEQPEHPLLRFFDAEGMDYRGAQGGLRMPAGSSLLVAGEGEGGRVPLIYWVSRPEGQTLVVNLDPAESGFYLSPAFPVLVRSAALALTRREEGLPGQLRLGQWVTMPVGLAGGEVMILTEPSGQRRELGAGESWLVEEAGVYGVAGLGWEGAAGLFHAEESFAPADWAKRAGAMEGGVEPAGVGGRPWSWWLGLAALGLVTVESLLYHRRKVG